MSVALLTVAGVALDALLGEPQRRHPLVAFGRSVRKLRDEYLEKYRAQGGKVGKADKSDKSEKSDKSGKGKSGK